MKDALSDQTRADYCGGCRRAADGVTTAAGMATLCGVDGAYIPFESGVKAAPRMSESYSLPTEPEGVVK